MAEIDMASKMTFKQSSDINIVPQLENISSIEDDKKWEYKRLLQKYFLSGKSSGVIPHMSFRPLSLTSLTDEADLYSIYPIILDHKSKAIHPFKDRVTKMAEEYLREEDQKVIRKEMDDLLQGVQLITSKKDNLTNRLKCIKETMEALFSLGEKMIEPERWIELCKELEQQLVTDKITIIGFSDYAPFLLLKYYLDECHTCQLNFLDLINKRIAGLNDILVLHGAASKGSEGQFDFASDLLSFNKIEELAPLEASSSLPEGRLKRVQECYNILVDAQRSNKDYSTIIFSDTKLAEEYQVKEIFEQSQLELINSGVCIKAKAYYQDEIEKFALVTAALKIADLELSQQYVEDLHDAYFKNYDFNYLGDDDLKYMRSIIVLDFSQNLMNDASDFLELVSGGAVVNILGVNKLGDIVNVDQKKDGYFELASIAFSRRKAFVYQGGLEDPLMIQAAFESGLEEPYPVLWNILLNGGNNGKVEEKSLQIKLARDCRLFPSIIYNIEAGEAFGSHFDLSGNEQNKVVLPQFSQKVRNGEQLEEMECYLTIADYLSIFSEHAPDLEMIPSWYDDTELVPLSSYLNAGYRAMDDKVPYIWVTGEDDKIHRIAIPISWVIFCRKHLDYWRFLQELGGLNNPMIDVVVEKVKTDWEKSKETQIKALETKLKDEFEQVKKSELEKSIQVMLYRLIEGDLDINALSTGKVEVVAKIVQPVDETKPDEVSKDEKDEEPLFSEVWVETDECTSCNDCIDAVPGVFKYNDDKQAYVHNPTGSSFAKIVAAAEKCPAGCIHPGQPHNPVEPDLDKLIQRAEKFN